MMTVRRFALVLAGGLWPAISAAQTPLTIAPVSHHFGRIAVGATAIQDFALGGVSLGDSLVVAGLQGPDADDWTLSGVHGATPAGTVYAPCLQRMTGMPGVTLPLVYSGSGCGQRVTFLPQSTGRKRAELVVIARGGRRIGAVLTGEAVEPLCTTTVVWCNFAHLYSGSLSWKIDLRGVHGSNQISIEVTVDAGEAWCTGSEIETGPAGPWRGTITGPGLIGVEFLSASGGKLEYRITVACPTPEFPDHADGSQGQASEPAELGNGYSIETYTQAAAEMNQLELSGGRTYPAPETDPVNGVTGSVSLTWKLTRTKTPPTPPPATPPS